MRQLIITSCLLIHVMLMTGCQRLRGEADAQQDIANGQLMIWDAGKMGHNYPIYQYLLREKYGIEAQTSGCIVTRDLREYNRGYNHIMEEEIESRFGDGILETVRAEARELYNRPGSPKMKWYYDRLKE